MRKVLLSFSILLCVVCNIYAGPFGLEQGMNLEQIQEACGGREPIKIDDSRYFIVPAKQHPYFTKYVAWIDETQGLNYIKAIGSNISTNGYGFELKSKFDDLEASLSKSYGKSSKTNFLMPGSIWDDLDEWMKSLEKNERYYFCSWSKKNGSTLPDTLTGIYLSARAEDSYSGGVDLEYEFANHESIQTKKKAIEDSVF